MTARRRVLHVGNISNLAFVNAEILNGAGYENHVAHPDFYHFASCPEWNGLHEDDADRVDLSNEFFPDFRHLPPSRRRRPDWFAQGPLPLVCLYLRALLDRDACRAATARAVLDYQRLKAIVLRTTTPQTHVLSLDALLEILRDSAMSRAEVAGHLFGQRFDALLARMRAIAAPYSGEEATSSIAPPFASDYLDAFCHLDPRFGAEVRRLRATGRLAAAGFEVDPLLLGPVPPPPTGVETSDAAVYAASLPYWSALFARYDYVVLTAEAPLLGHLLGIRHYLAFEHGSLRALPWATTPSARLAREGYRHAPVVLVTNADYITAHQRLELDPAQVFYLPHTYDERLPARARAAHVRVSRGAGPVRFVAPARQDWVAHDPGLSKGNDRIVRAAALLRDRGHDLVRVTFIDWGRDVAATRTLIAELDLQEWFAWAPPMPKPQLWRAFMDADAVIDQFLISSLGGVSYDGLALGCRVITHDDGIANATFFPEPPPLLAAQSVEEIADRLAEVAADPDDKRGVGRRGLDWITRYHSAQRVVDVERNAFGRVDALAQMPA